MSLWFYELDPQTMDIEWYDCDSSKIEHTCQISNIAHCKMLQMVLCSLGPPDAEPGNYSEWVNVT